MVICEDIFMYFSHIKKLFILAYSPRVDSTVQWEVTNDSLIDSPNITTSKSMIPKIVLYRKLIFAPKILETVHGIINLEYLECLHQKG